MPFMLATVVFGTRFVIVGAIGFTVKVVLFNPPLLLTVRRNVPLVETQPEGIVAVNSPLLTTSLAKVKLPTVVPLTSSTAKVTEGVSTPA